MSLSNVQTVTYPFTLVGGYTGGAGTITIREINKDVVDIYITQTTTALVTTVANPLTTATAVIPKQFTPSYPIAFACVVNDSLLPKAGYLVIQTTGKFAFQLMSNANWAGSDQTGLLQFSCSYNKNA